MGKGKLRVMTNLNPILVDQLEDAITELKTYDTDISPYLDEKHDLLTELVQFGTKINLASKEDYSRLTKLNMI